METTAKAEAGKVQFARSRMLWGEDGQERLCRASVAVFGLGGVGAAVTEALARGGIGHLILIDGDTVSESNINRQLIATHGTVGRAKADAARERVLSINPGCRVDARLHFVTAEEALQWDFDGVDYVVDAVDNVSVKLALAEHCSRDGIRLISCMGTGNKRDPSRLRVADITETSVCPLARVMRRELTRRGVKHLRVVYSDEKPMTPSGGEEPSPGKRAVPGSLPFVPPAAGLILAGEVLRTLSGLE